MALDAFVQVRLDSNESSLRAQRRYRGVSTPHDVVGRWQLSDVITRRIVRRIAAAFMRVAFPDAPPGNERETPRRPGARAANGNVLFVKIGEQRRPRPVGSLRITVLRHRVDFVHRKFGRLRDISPRSLPPWRGMRIPQTRAPPATDPTPSECANCAGSFRSLKKNSSTGRSASGLTSVASSAGNGTSGLPQSANWPVRRDVDGGVFRPISTTAAARESQRPHHCDRASRLGRGTIPPRLEALSPGATFGERLGTVSCFWDARGTLRSTPVRSSCRRSPPCGARPIRPC